MTDTSLDVLGGAAGAARAIDGEAGRSVKAGLRRAAGPLALALGEIASIQAALLAAGGVSGLGAGVLPTPAGGLWTPSFGMAAALVVLALNATFGLFETAGISRFERFRLRVYVASCLPWPLLGVLALAGPPAALPALELCGAAVVYLAFALLAGCRIRRALIAQGAWGEDVALIGPADAARRIAEELRRSPEVGFRPARYLGEIGAETPPLAAVPGVPSGAQPGSPHPDIALVVLSPGMGSLDMARLPYRRVVLVPGIGGIPALWGRSRAVGGGAGLDFANPRPGGFDQRAKRALDLVVALPLLVLTLPLVLAAVLGIRLVSPGPALFVQHRVGWNGRPVAILKLRSMHLDAERRLAELLERDPAARREWNTHMKLARDPRVLPVVGGFIRRTSIDELPQLWNVVRGDISLVGPRPFPAYHVGRFTEEFQALRSSVRPGLTGLWQVSDRSDADLGRQEAIDTFYIRNWSLWLDVYIVFRTLPAVLSARGAR